MKINERKNAFFLDWSFYIYIFIIPFYGGGKFSFQNVLVWVFLCVEIIFNSNKFRFKLNPILNNKDYSTFLLLSIISGIIAVNYFFAVIILMRYILLFLALLFLINSFNKSNYLQAQKVIEIIFWINIFLGVMQYFRIEQFYYSDINSINNNTNLFEDNSVLRSWGTFGNTLVYVAFMLPISLYFTFKFLISKKRFLFYIYLFSTIILLIITASRGALISLSISIILISLIDKTVSKFVLFIIPFFFIIFLFFEGFRNAVLNLSLIDRIVQNKQDLGYGRVEIWEKVYKIAVDNLFIGTGPGNLGYSLVENNFDGANSSKPEQHVESVFLTILLTNGIFGLYFYVRIIFYPLLLMIKLFRVNKILFQPIIPFIAFFSSFIFIMFSNPAFLDNPGINMIYFCFLALFLFSIQNLDTLILKKR